MWLTPLPYRLTQSSAGKAAGGHSSSEWKAAFLLAHNFASDNDRRTTSKAEPVRHVGGIMCQQLCAWVYEKCICVCLFVHSKTRGTASVSGDADDVCVCVCVWSEGRRVAFSTVCSVILTHCWHCYICLNRARWCVRVNWCVFSQLFDFAVCVLQFANTRWVKKPT